MNRIIVGYDDTEPSRRALERAAQMTKAFGAELIVTSVAPVLHSIGRSIGPLDPTDPPSRHAQELAHAKELLEREGVQAEYYAAVGEPADAIVELAEERGADLIVLGTREPNFLERVLGHSVSGAVSHKAHRDVMIVH